MAKSTKTKKDPKTILGIIFISGGSTFFSSSDTPLEEMAAKVVKQTVKDWKHLFKFKKDGEWIVPIYDVSKCKQGWVAQSMPYGIFPVLKNGKLGKKPCKWVKSIKLYY